MVVFVRRIRICLKACSAIMIGRGFAVGSNIIWRWCLNFADTTSWQLPVLVICLAAAWGSCSANDMLPSGNFLLANSMPNFVSWGQQKCLGLKNRGKPGGRGAGMPWLGFILDGCVIQQVLPSLLFTWSNYLPSLNQSFTARVGHMSTIW